MKNAEAIHVQPNTGRTMGSAAACSFSGCIMPDMASSGQGSERLNAQLLVDSIPSLIHTARPDGYLDYFNKPWLEYLGVTLDKMTGWNWTAFIHPEDLDGIVGKWRACLATGEIFEYETRVRRANGEYRWMFHRKVPLRDENGNIVKWYGSSLDIDERKTAEEQLRRNAQELQRSEFYLAEGQRLAHMGSWAFDPDGFYYWSPEIFRMHGLDPASKPPSVQEYLDRVHPQDRESMANLIKGILAEASPFDATKRIVRPNGEVRYIRCVGAPVVENRILKRYVGSAIDVTEHALLTQDLRRREAYLSDAQRLSHTGSWAWNLRTGTQFWSEEIYRIYGYNPQEVAPTWEQFLERVHPEDRPQIEQRAKMEATGREWSNSHGDFRIVLPDGTIKYLHSVAHPVRDGSGETAEIIGTVMDVTEHELLTQELRRREAYLAEAQRLSHTGSFGWKPDTGEIIWSDETYRIFEYDRSVNPTIDSVAQRVHPQDRAGFQKVTDGASQGATDFEHSYRLLLLDGRVKHVHAIAHVLQDASGNREFVGAVTDITERKAAEEARRSSEAYLAEAQRLSHTGSWAWNAATGEPGYWSEECYRVLGYDPAEPLPLLEAFFQRILSDERAAIREQFDKAIRDKADFEVDLSFVHPTTGIRNIHSVSHAVLDQRGDLREIVGTVIDITERKRAEEDLRASERKYRHLVDTTPAFIHTALPDGSLDFLSRGWLEYGGLPQTDFLDWRWTAAIHPEDVKGFVDKWRAALASGEAFVAESRVRRADGEYHWFLQRNVPLRDETGKIVKWYGTGTDIEERKRAEESLRRSESYLAEAQKLSHTGSWAWSPDTDVRHWSEECYRVLGFDPRDGLPRTEELIQRIHPDDQPAFRESTKRAKYEKLDEEVDYRIVHPGGAVRDIHSTGHPVFSPSGDLIEFTGTVIDVTERKRAEEELRRSEMELRQMLDFTPQLVAVFGPNRERLYVNRITLDYLGMTLDEWRQGSTGDGVHPEDSERLKAYVDRASSSGRGFELELRVRKGDGSYRWFLARYNPVRDNKGQVMRWYVACTDIEDRKQAEDTLRRENVALREEIDKTSMFEEIVGASSALQPVLSHISKVAPSDSTVLITGETGTGKELVARAIHRRSARSSRPFVSVNCAAIPRDLVASELFGHEKGAFTGATQQRLGRFELASGGTIFLDEVGELPAETQISLLRVLQEREFERVGGNRRIRADVRVIAATNRDLQTTISAGSFRSDLFYRLNVFPIEMPSLRERRTDIPLLVEYFIDRYARKAGKNIKHVNKKTLDLLQAYSWPGNIRELQNVIERSVILCETEIFSIDENWIPQPSPRTPESEQQAELPRRLLVQAKDMIEAALKDTGGRVSGPTGAAVKLGIPRSTLESKIRLLKIDKNRFKD
jgi:PAS domain S-box-containing protein